MAEMGKVARDKHASAIRDDSSSKALTPLSLLLRLLIFFYWPFLLLLGGGIVGAVVGIIGLSVGGKIPLLLVFVAVILLVLLGQLLACFVVLLERRMPDENMEMRLKRDKLAGLHSLVRDVAVRRGLRPPDEIRLAADTLAHVYEDEDGQEILVIGGLALTALTQDALAGVLAHELAHFAHGDTRLSRRARNQQLVMGALEFGFQMNWMSWINPFVWLMRLYHLTYFAVWMAHSRQQEYAADRHEVELVGKEEAAATLLYLTLPDRLPYLRLSSIAETCVSTDQPMQQIFTEQRRRARNISPGDWKDACRKELKEQTGWFDSHPALRDRLNAMGVSPKKALNMTLERSGPPAYELLPEWNAIEMRLTDKLIAIFVEISQAKREIAQIVLGRPL